MKIFVFQVTLDFQESQARLEQLDLLVHLVQLDSMDPLVVQVSRVKPVAQEPLEQLE